MNPEDVYSVSVEGGGTWTDISRHLPYLRQCAHGNCFEIGVRSGVSTAALLMGLKDKGNGHLWSIDIADCGHLYDNPLWTFIRAHSVEDAQRVKEEIPSPLEVVFIDANHDYDSTLAELRIYGSMVRHQGGVILLHDTDLIGSGVKPAILEFCKEAKCHANFHDGSYGLGILTWDKRALDPEQKEAA